MTKTKMLCSAAGAILLAVGALPVQGEAQSAPTQCTQAHAQAAIGQGKALFLCGCDTVTRGMVTYVQKRDDFLGLLDGFESSCAGLANVLADVPTASTDRPSRSGGRSDDERSSRMAADPGGDEEVEPYEEASEESDDHKSGHGSCQGGSKGQGNGGGNGQGSGNGKGNCDQCTGEKGGSKGGGGGGSGDDHDHTDESHSH